MTFAHDCIEKKQQIEIDPKNESGCTCNHFTVEGVRVSYTVAYSAQQKEARWRCSIWHVFKSDETSVTEFLFIQICTQKPFTFRLWLASFLLGKLPTLDGDFAHTIARVCVGSVQNRWSGRFVVLKIISVKQNEYNCVFCPAVCGKKLNMSSQKQRKFATFVNSCTNTKLWFDFCGQHFCCADL